MKLVIAGGTGFLGSVLIKHFDSPEHRLVILTRQKLSDHGNVKYCYWDGCNFGAWKDELENAAAVINLNGKSVDCRYTRKNKALIYSTRLDSTAILGKAIQQCINPPGVWINAASSTIYRHSLDIEMSEAHGETGNGFSEDVCKKWESVFNSISLSHTRKVILRTAIVLGKRGGALQPMKLLTKTGMGGAQGRGDQFISWIHETDFARIVELAIHRDDMTGIYNVTSPFPIRNAVFMRELRKVSGWKFGFPMPEWLIGLGTFIIRTEPELILKSRRVIPSRLMELGFEFEYVKIDETLLNLVAEED